jgi:hypothetical protein
VSARDRSRESIFTSIAQAGDSGPQTGPELSPSALDVPALLLEVGAALPVKRIANLSELSKGYCAWICDIGEVFPYAFPEPVISWRNTWAQLPQVGCAMPNPPLSERFLRRRI